VAQFDRVVRPSRGPRRHAGAALAPVFEPDVDLDRRIAAAVEDLAADDIGNGSHGVPGRSQRPPGFYRIENTLVMPRGSGASNNLQIGDPRSGRPRRIAPG